VGFWFLVLIFCAVAFFVMYRIFDERIRNASGLDVLVQKHKKEVESTMVLFNKTAYENISALEAKIRETQELIKSLEKRLDETRKFKVRPLAVPEPDSTNSVQSSVVAPSVVESNERSFRSVDVKVGEPHNVVEFTPGAKKPIRKVKDKKDIIIDLFNGGETISSIATRLDISQEEVRYFVKRFVKM
jgi:hypothetical protein